MKSVFLSVVVLLACVNLGLCIKCYLGTKSGDAKLEPDDLMDNEVLPWKVCTKTTTTIGGTKTVILAGLPIKQANRCTKVGHVEQCFCDTDACNTAHTSATLLLPLLVLPLLVNSFL